MFLQLCAGVSLPSILNAEKASEISSYDKENCVLPKAQWKFLYSLSVVLQVASI